MTVTPRTSSDTAPEVLWTPPLDGTSSIESFTRWAQARRRQSLPDYRSLHEWSISAPQQFWGDIADFFSVHFHTKAEEVLTSATMPDTQWFPGATLNYAEQALRQDEYKASTDLALIFEREDGTAAEWTYGELRTRVAAAQNVFRAAGVHRGDRVAGLLPNTPHALVAFLAAASIGAVWTACSPDFGERAVIDRLAQVEPVLLIAVDGYLYNGRRFDITDTIRSTLDAVPSITTTLVIDYIGSTDVDARWLPWERTSAELDGAVLSYEPVPFGHPLWILYSSGTTGLPKAIVHSHGGIVLEHLKVLNLQMGLGPDERFLWFTTTGWMMWNLLVSGLMVGSTIVLYDGNPAYPNLGRLWKLAAEHRVTYFGTSAPFVHTCREQGLDPAAEYDLSAIRTIGSTGSPLSTEGFHWIRDHMGEAIQISSISGGTDLCTAFLGSAPTVPVWTGELSCAALGADVQTLDDSGAENTGHIGELVLATPMPSMPVSFWNDDDGSRLREAYFETYPGKWRHGDWLEITSRGSAVIHGRSDATLNRGGVRMGTAEFYRVLESDDAVTDSLVVDTSALTSDGAGEGQLLCFIVLRPDSELSAVVPRLRALIRTQLSPRHVPDRFIPAPSVPRTRNGKKCEVPVKKILAGIPAETAVNADALSHAGSLDFYIRTAQDMRQR
ncbi:acetoacetate--CoA ligase [Rhodococcus sp. 15-725-2-2b]|uniref:acetoacetate--CoA ligase n=1 Tax=unclassified Rhodococcus (in: high G+C Gram-positive bacteria) TaxID=192944 RepID=UPI000B9A3825|nr:MULTISPECIES: acetoacetate--CoA ligase [unclassified Rhodococcus (in: high G+C Gram-positive bacteria)]OZC63532.1 acetoacetate--CoA ligase [Rhodococcus sp. 06-469-3-2]OZD40697.1 acetoacetate--CoA ligase [Rhodococcus sp. 06-1477-1A]OZE67195.1 acetoacetate--CoA ligase [Rhodococcus sp. 15-725-2-2b]